MRSVITHAAHSGIVEVDCDRVITTEPIEFFLGNDEQRIADIVDAGVFKAGIEVAKLFGYLSVTFSGTQVIFIGKIHSRTVVERLAKVFSLWARTAPIEIREEPDPFDSLDCDEKPTRDRGIDPEDWHDSYDMSTPEGTAFASQRHF